MFWKVYYTMMGAFLKKHRKISTRYLRDYNSTIEFLKFIDNFILISIYLKYEFNFKLSSCKQKISVILCKILFVFIYINCWLKCIAIVSSLMMLVFTRYTSIYFNENVFDEEGNNSWITMSYLFIAT